MVRNTGTALNGID